MERNQECEQVRALISAFLDNEVDSKEAVLMTNHLEACVPCRHEHDRLQAVRTVLRTLPSPPVAVRESARARAFARLEQAIVPPASPTRLPFWKGLLNGPSFRPLVASMALAVVTGTVVLLWPMEDLSVPRQGASVSVPTTAEWDNLFHRHDAQSVSYSADDPALKRDAAAEAHASLLRQADEELSGNL